MAGIALKRSIRPCFHNGPSGGVIKIKRNLFRKKGSLKKILFHFHRPYQRGGLFTKTNVGDIDDSFISSFTLYF